MQLKKFINMCPFFLPFFFFLSFSGSCLSVFCRVLWLFLRTVASCQGPQPCTLLPAPVPCTLLLHKNPNLHFYIFKLSEVFKTNKKKIQKTKLPTKKSHQLFSRIFFFFHARTMALVPCTYTLLTPWLSVGQLIPTWGALGLGVALLREAALPQKTKSSRAL